MCWGDSGRGEKEVSRRANAASPDEKECRDARGGIATTQAALLLLLLMRSNNSASVVGKSDEGGCVRRQGEGDRCGGLGLVPRGPR